MLQSLYGVANQSLPLVTLCNATTRAVIFQMQSVSTVLPRAAPAQRNRQRRRLARQRSLLLSGHSPSRAADFTTNSSNFVSPLIDLGSPRDSRDSPVISRTLADSCSETSQQSGRFRGQYLQQFSNVCRCIQTPDQRVREIQPFTESLQPRHKLPPSQIGKNFHCTL